MVQVIIVLQLISLDGYDGLLTGIASEQVAAGRLGAIGELPESDTLLADGWLLPHGSLDFSFALLLESRQVLLLAQLCLVESLP